jgi:hypothetical protein
MLGLIFIYSYMSNIAHFFDFNCLVDINQQAWIIDKNKPNIPLFKIPISELKMMKSGIYLKKGNKMEFNGNTFYLSDELSNKLKVIASKTKSNYSDFVISLQEFMNKSIVDETEFKLNLKPLLELKNKMDDIYIICSKQTHKTYDKIVNQILEECKENGLVIKKFYFLNENFLNQNDDDVKFKQMRLILQHLIGYKTDGDKFTDVELEKYSLINFYDNNLDTIKVADNIVDLLEIIINNTDKGLKDVVKEDLQDETPLLCVYKINDNQFNPKLFKKVKVNLPRLIKTFESFKKINPFL